MSDDKRLKPEDAKTHTVVVVWNGSVGEERYIYHDPNGWYVLGWPCAHDSERYYVPVDDAGYFVGVTTP